MSKQSEDKDLGLLGNTASGNADNAKATPSDWQPIATAPKDEDALLLYSDREGVQCGYWDSDCECWLAQETQVFTGGRAQPTHWMPLPAPPASLGD